ncbi:MAG TPA: hypothetical protein VLE48_02685 [Terriglobales bacterium]|nr:hypothetical protein [Terriglobales bacterium]
MNKTTRLADGRQRWEVTAMGFGVVPKRLGALLLLLTLVAGFGLTASAFQKKGGGGSTGPLYLLATFLNAGNEITSDSRSASYLHGVDGQVTLGKPGAGRFRLDLGKLNPNGRVINIDLSACGASCDNINGPEVAFLQSGSEFFPPRDADGNITRDTDGNIIGDWTTSGETALDIRSMRMSQGERYAHLYAHLTADSGGFSRRFIYSRPEHVLEVWRCNDVRAEPAKVVCTAEAGTGARATCARWEISGKNGCFRKSQDSLNRTWSTTYLEDVGLQVTLVPAP